MRQLSDDVIAEINTAISRLLKLDIVQMQMEQVQSEFHEVDDLLIKYGIEKETTYSRKLDILFQRARYYFNSKILVPLGEGMWQKYRGIIKTNKRKYCINVDIHPNKFRICNTYKGKIRLSWTFSPTGKIQSLESVVFSRGEHKKLILVNNDVNPAWTQTQANCKSFPDEIYDVNPEFRPMSELEKYGALMRYGHATAIQIVNNMRRNEIETPDNLNRDQIPLSEIVESEEAKEMLWKTEKLFPKISAGNNKDLIQIAYGRKR
jgi:hypothetical protein